MYSGEDGSNVLLLFGVNLPCGRHCGEKLQDTNVHVSRACLFPTHKIKTGVEEKQ